MEPSSPFNKSLNVSISSEENRFKEIENFISTLPRESSWDVPEHLYKYQDFWCYSFILKGVTLLQEKFTPQPTDIFLCTLPKSGTTWLKALCFSVLNRTQNLDTDSKILTKMPHDLVPILEFDYCLGHTRDLENPLMSTHLPFTSLPQSIINSNSKIIYLFRDPKDVLVSLWNFYPKLGKDLQVIQFQEAYEKFCNGVLAYGPYWDHVLGYWKASLKYPERTLFLKYEDLKNDTSFYVKKMGDFMGCPFSIDEEKQGIVEKIVELCSFENMRNLEVNKREDISPNVLFQIENNAFFRKGKAGDWKNYLTVEMAERVDQITHQKFKNSGLYI